MMIRGDMPKRRLALRDGIKPVPACDIRRRKIYIRPGQEINHFLNLLLPCPQTDPTKPGVMSDTAADPNTRLRVLRPYVVKLTE